MGEVLAAFAWNTNGVLIADVAQLGYMHDDDIVIDVTYGRGVFWSKWRPRTLVVHDLKIDGVDFRSIPHPDGSADVGVIDGPYKLNGTPDPDVDERYGVDVEMHWTERIALIEAGMTELGRVLRPYRRGQRKSRMLVKCQDQVCSGAIRWQTDIFTRHAQTLGFAKVDRFDLLGNMRPQPGGRSQKHAHGRPSTLLVFERRNHKEEE